MGATVNDDDNRAQTREEYDEAVAFCLWLRGRAAEASERGEHSRCTRLAVAANVIAKWFLLPEAKP